MNRSVLISAFILGAFFGLALFSAQAGPSGGGAPVLQGSQSAYTKQLSVLDLPTGPDVDAAYRVWMDAEQVDLETGEIRSFRLKDTIKVDREEFFKRYRNNLGLGQDDHLAERKLLSLPKAGWVVSRHGQKYKGLEVLGAEYILTEKEGTVLWAQGRLALGLDLDVTPQITEAAALESALNDVGAVYAWEEDPENHAPPKGMLAIASKDFTFTKESFLLVWRFVVSSKKPFDSWTVDVDAKTGEVLHKLSNRRDVDVTGKGLTLYDGKRTFTVDEVKAGHYQLRIQGPPSIKTLQGIIGVGVDAGTDIFDQDTDFDDENHRLGVSVHFGLEQASNFYKSKWGWVGWDGNGQTPVQAFVVKGDEPYAVYFGGDMETMFFTDAGTDDHGPFATLDVIGHEFTHAVIDHAVGGPHVGERGALNEGFADIMGMLIRRIAKGSADWCFGGDAYKEKGKCTRNAMLPSATFNPKAYKGENYLPTNGPCTDENDKCHVHQNSTVLSHWFYLLSEGDKVSKNKIEGIGLDNAASVAFYTMVNSSLSSFMDARVMSLAVAGAMFGKGSEEYSDVVNAWHAVGVGPPYQPERQCEPATGSKNIDPWPAELKCKPLSGEYEWEIQISPRLGFDQEVKILKPKLDHGLVSAQAHLKPDTFYLWRIRAKKGPPQGEPMKVRKETGLFGSANRWFKDFLAPEETVVQKEEWTDWSPARALITGPKSAVLKTPVEGASVAPWGILLSWDKVTGADRYRVTVSKKADLSEPEFDSDQVGGHKVSVSLPQHNGSYHWAVVPRDLDSGESGESQKRSFTVDYNKTKTKLWLPNKDQVFGSSIDYKWDPIDGAVHYKLAFYQRVNNTAGPFAGGETAQVSNWSSKKHSFDKNGYCWKVQSFGSNNQPGLVSDLACYGMIPPQPILLAPTNGASHVSYKSTQLNWACNLCKQYSPDYFFSLEIVSPKLWGIATKQFSHVTKLEPGTTYKWRVKAFSKPPGELMSTSQTSTFTTTGTPTEEPAQQQQQQTGVGSLKTGQCNSTITTGGDQSESFVIDFGMTKGYSQVFFNFVKVPDSFTLKCQAGGKVLVNTGCVATYGLAATPVFQFNCPTSKVVASVTANCKGYTDTIWGFLVACP